MVNVLSVGAIRQLEEAAAAELTARRAKALENLREVNSRLTEVAALHDEKAEAARIARDTVVAECERRIADANAEVRRTAHAKAAAALPLEQQRNALVFQLETELCPAEIVDGLREVEELRARHRRLQPVEQTVYGKFIPNPENAVAAKVASRCVIAAEQLRNMRFEMVDDVGTEVAAIVAGVVAD